jgi:Fe-S cluster biogenesis protein NfuA/nitrite reductase/ring-hydroxylating ferredoxin subunit
MAEAAATLDDRAARERIAVVERLLEEVEGLPDPAARAAATDLVAALLDLYGEGLARLIGCVAEHDDGELATALAEDELVAHLLLLHGLHPVSLESRVRGALADVRPYLESHGGDVELLGVADGVASLRLEGSCDGCPSSAATLKLAIEDAIQKAAPDIERVEAQGAVADARATASLIQLEVAAPLPKTAAAGSGSRRAWASTDDLADLADGAQLLRDVAGEPVLFLRLDRRVYAYRPACPACDASLADGALEGTHLICAGCGRRYDARRAGRCLDGPALHLEPVPLLSTGDGRLKVALAAPA